MQGEGRKGDPDKFSKRHDVEQVVGAIDAHNVPESPTTASSRLVTSLDFLF